MPELRQNPATSEWVIIATERAARPEDFIKQKPATKPGNHCPFCPGNEKLTPPEIMAYRPFNTTANSPGWWIRIVPNKYPSLINQGSVHRHTADDFFRYMDGVGSHEVIIESPNHEDSIATMDEKQVEEVFLAYRERHLRLEDEKRFEKIIIFKNHGVQAGTSVYHPHSQLIATPVIPLHIRHRLEEAMRYFDNNGECVYCVMIKKEKECGQRVVLETENFIAFEPFASRSPFETLIFPKIHSSTFTESTEILTKEFAYITKVTLSKIYQGLHDPDYNYILLTGPSHEKALHYYHWHLQILPRVSALAGFELGSGIYINTVIPEHAARFLRGI